MGTRAEGKKGLGVAACTAIVVGNMVGSGFYLSPAAVAPYGNLAILAWVVMGGGAICLGLTFAKLAKLAPATGGPYAYTRMAYGDFPGFLIAWGYWISIWASLPVIAIAFAGAVMDLVPVLQSRAMAVALTLAAIWSVVLVNLRGVKAAGIFAEITTYSKLVPLVAIALIGLPFIVRAAPRCSPQAQPSPRSRCSRISGSSRPRFRRVTSTTPSGPFHVRRFSASASRRSSMCSAPWR
jgi:amino acid transporter